MPAGSTLAGASLRELRFRQRHNATVLALRRGQQTVQERLGQAILREGDVLLLQAPRDSIRGLQDSNDLLVLDQFENDLPNCNKKTNSNSNCNRYVDYPLNYWTCLWSLQS